MIDNICTFTLPHGRLLAAPSWVFPGTIYENGAFLSGKVQEVGLLCYETASSLAYSHTELPPELAAMPLKWHVHLPLDLPWDKPEQAVSACLDIMGKVDFLGVRRAVLHPPIMDTSCADKKIIGKLGLFAEHWMARGYNISDLMLENIPVQHPEIIMNAAQATGCSLCLDLAHYILYYRQHSKAQGYASRLRNWLNGELDAELAPMLPFVRMVHLCAPGGAGAKGHHFPLTELTPEEKGLGAEICAGVSENTIFMVEVFNWKGYTDSIPILYNWLQDASRKTG